MVYIQYIIQIKSKERPFSRRSLFRGLTLSLRAEVENDVRPFLVIIGKQVRNSAIALGVLVASLALIYFFLCSFYISEIIVDKT